METNDLCGLFLLNGIQVSIEERMYGRSLGELYLCEPMRWPTPIDRVDVTEIESLTPVPYHNEVGQLVCD